MAPILIDSYRNVPVDEVDEDGRKTKPARCNRCESTTVIWQTGKSGKRYLCEIFDIEGEQLYSHVDFHSRYCGQTPAVKQARLDEILEAALSDDDEIKIAKPYPRRRRKWTPVKTTHNTPTRTMNLHNQPEPMPVMVNPGPQPDPVISLDFTPTTPGQNMSDSIYYDGRWDKLAFKEISKAQKGAELLLTGQAPESKLLTPPELQTMTDMWLHLQWRLQNELPS